MLIQLEYPSKALLSSYLLAVFFFTKVWSGGILLNLFKVDSRSCDELGQQHPRKTHRASIGAMSLEEYSLSRNTFVTTLNFNGVEFFPRIPTTRDFNGQFNERVERTTSYHKTRRYNLIKYPKFIMKYSLVGGQKAQERMRSKGKLLPRERFVIPIILFSK